MIRVPLKDEDVLLLTRERGRKVGLGLPNGPVLLDFEGVEVASPSFLDELLRVADGRALEVEITNANRGILANLRRLNRAMDRGTAVGA